ncbi:type 2 isopentenyl-diphosphate Delta-isomerase [Shimia marina]|uniref:Isopentenyl-diphosphate delta-isomerase n=1 Tax=Shimia marina TaxID=321267 RepID=A0A0P1ELN2_9RHOB|nr:type 2 isopentenyl-diphosphate Delta-isomerase [Shimia marina]CUH51338.1 Isopentenyl-diphosphate delta-isomerase [Shimia marina]SFD51677.1 isopentenyl-diphosphate delta-isomerase [Shimia marina]
MSKDSVDRSVAGRKLEHIRAIQSDPQVERRASGFDQISLTHRALPELDFDQIDTTCTFLGKPLSFPMLISSMTGGSGEECLQLNRNLAIAAQETGVAMAVGSQRVMFTNRDAAASFDLRALAPDVPLLANIGAVQLNKGFSLKHCRAAVDVLKADALYLHLNPLQEAVQPEGDRNFSDLTSKIAQITHDLDVPVILKEVGSGLSQADINLGLTAGISHFDVAGRGGTSWSRIEYHRRSDDDDDLGLVFQDWGLTTVESLIGARETLSHYQRKTTLIASGGIRNGVDMAKSVILGADLCGVAAPFLEAAQDSSDSVVRKIRKFQKEFITAMFLLGTANVQSLQGNTSLIR